MAVNITIFHNRPVVGESIAWCLEFASPHRAEYLGSPINFKETHVNPCLILADPPNILLLPKSENVINCPVIVMIHDFADPQLRDALNSGVAAVVDLTKGPEKLIGKVQQLLEHNTDEVDVLIQQKRHQKPHTESDENNYHLTSKEKQILKQLREGIHLKMVAHNTGTRYETVRTHVKHIYRKLGVVSISEAMIKAMKMNLD